LAEFGFDWSAGWVKRWGCHQWVRVKVRREMFIRGVGDKVLRMEGASTVKYSPVGPAGYLWLSPGLPTAVQCSALHCTALGPSRESAITLCPGHCDVPDRLH
jgi:hypothetical protein